MVKGLTPYDSRLVTYAFTAGTLQLILPAMFPLLLFNNLLSFIKVDCTTTIPASRALYLYRFAGDTPGWEQVYITPQPQNGNVIVQHTVIHHLTGIRGPNNEILIGVSSQSEGAVDHALAIDYLEIGIT